MLEYYCWFECDDCSILCRPWKTLLYLLLVQEARMQIRPVLQEKNPRKDAYEISSWLGLIICLFLINLGSLDVVGFMQ